jgi:hypothetical protein
LAHRAFRDERGQEWQVWDVYPTSDAAVKPELRGGWLAFESHDEKRRLAPIPPGWETASEAELLALLARATLRDKPRRLIE